MKGINPSSLTPCQIVLINKIKRVNFVAAIWKNAVLRRQPDWKPEDHGWKKLGNSVIINWFEGDQVPQSVEDILLDENTDHPEETTEEVHADSDEDDGTEASSDESEEQEF